MTLQTHIKFVVYSFLTWLVFYLIGLPDYYQSWPFWSKLVLVVFVTGIYFPITAYCLRKFFHDGHHLDNAVWLALYLTLPLFFYDYLLLALYFDLGIQFVFPYWYLSFFYLSFWVQFPLVALWMLKRESEA